MIVKCAISDLVSLFSLTLFLSWCSIYKEKDKIRRVWLNDFSHSDHRSLISSQVTI
jgi:hypothetical protein